MKTTYFAHDAPIDTLREIPEARFSCLGRRNLRIEEFEMLNLEPNTIITISLSLVGGKGGFGSLLRAIGSQISKTTDQQSKRYLDGRRIRNVNQEKTVEEQRKRKIEKDKEDEIEREARKKKKLENAKNTVEGRHGGKHYFEDEEYIKSKKVTTETTIESTQKAAQLKLIQEAAEKKRLEEEERIRQQKRDENGGESSDESGSDLEDEFMPKKTPVITGPNLSNRTVTSNAKTSRHNNVMWSHMCGKNMDQAKPVEIVKYEDVNLDDFESIEKLEELGSERLCELLMLRGLKTGGSVNERADRLLKVKGLDQADYPIELCASR